MRPEESTRPLFCQLVFSSAPLQLADRLWRQIKLARHLTAADPQILNRQDTYKYRDVFTTLLNFVSERLHD
jgi:hypothetical protein